MHRIVTVDPGSPAKHHGILAGDSLVAIDTEPVVDIVDYEYLCAKEQLSLTLCRAGKSMELLIEKGLYEPLGLGFSSSLMTPVRSCKNHCRFCFIDQMPKGGRETLGFKDDDWRMSFIMGNYISLTNVDDEEFQRILRRRVSPLYISVHVTDPDLRVSIMKNPSAGRLMERLRALFDAGLQFHAQVVCCPGLNDGAKLQETMEDLMGLYPAARSLAVVPVGLTRFREGLSPLRPFTKAEAAATVEQIEAAGQAFYQKHGTVFAFASDEFYIIAGKPLPAYEHYEDFLQIENGVGLLRQFEREFIEALEERAPFKHTRRLSAAGGVAAAPFFRELYGRLAAYHVELALFPIQNDYFGHTVHVGGLITGQDLIAQLSGKIETETLLIPHNMLRERENVFLDGKTVGEVAAALHVRVVPVRGGGEAWVQAIFDTKRNAQIGRRKIREK